MKKRIAECFNGEKDIQYGVFTATDILKNPFPMWPVSKFPSGDLKDSFPDLSIGWMNLNFECGTHDEWPEM